MCLFVVYYGARPRALPNFRMTFRLLAPLLCCLSLCAAGCRLLPTLPPANLSEPGWHIREGQAVWRMKRDAPEIAGEVLLAINADGRAFVQFTKTPFPFLIGQSTTNRWQVELPTQNRRYSGPGKPPTRLIWLYLPRMLAGNPPPKNWSWQQLEASRWRLENAKTGELIEGYFASASATQRAPRLASVPPSSR